MKESAITKELINGYIKEIKILKRLVKAQNKMIVHYRVGESSMPEWVFTDIGNAKKFYGVSSISEIK